MVQALELVNLTADSIPSGSVLAQVLGTPDESLHLDEKIAVREAAFLTPKAPDFIFFRRFSDGRSSQAVAYVVDNTTIRFSAAELSELHRNIWLSGQAPLLYVEELGKVDIYSCAGSAAASKDNSWCPRPEDTIKLSSDITEAIKAKRFSAYRLVDGTFWEDELNAHLVNPSKSAHRKLIAEVEHADRELEGEKNPAARHLLLLALLLKYLEDREVFPSGWFSEFHPNSPSCLHVFKHGGKQAALKMFLALEDRFNGDIFRLSQEQIDIVDDALLRKLTNLICKDLDSKKGQFYLWDFYSFKHIPVEVLSHIYQKFADRGKGAVFTPPMVVNLMLDQVMPLRSLRGDETVIDPSCGSGIFLVSAFRRLVHAWCNARGWKRPTAKELTDLLSRTIFGIELQPQASELASFSLALAVCDALQPNVIWEQLRFDKLLNANIFTGDYCDHIDIAKSKTEGGKGFGIVVGNPPFMSTLTPAMEEKERRCKYNIPDKQSAYFFLLDCVKEALLPGGKLCLLQNAGFLYNQKADSFRKKFFSEVRTEGILDFVSVRGVFKGADVKVVAVLATNYLPQSEHFVHHWTFRRTFSADRLISFELDYYDYHKVPQKIAENYYWPWRANLLGGGRLLHLAMRLSKLQTLETFIQTKEWDIGEGFISGKKNARKLAPWLTGQPLLLTESFINDNVDCSRLSKVPSDQIYFDTPYTENRFSSPLVLIKENAKLHCAYWANGSLAYRAKIVGIHCPEDEAPCLKQFHDRFLKDKNKLQASCLLLGTQILVGKATVPDLLDICRLPWPTDGNWDLSAWEEIMLDDVTTYMAEYVRLGQDSLLLKQVPLEDRLLYAQTFLELLQKIFPNAVDAGNAVQDGLMYQAFHLYSVEPIEWLKGDWAQHARSVVFYSHGDAESFCSVRVLRIYDGNTLILFKPDRHRYWIRSAAIRDVDDVLNDMISGEEQNA
jgi:Type I restriction-modification system methyltransferase subunit